ncbi:hypothetical protein BT63DRAFT_414700 [Microthyrium microscopicum]|uniref:Uncharacterized protein n=1 Tax=Microthyrium microscopicum TaxID=703497 RepID=A0A6A6U978_9PEZI|nr:hypothetical protein BT63DRAFT_414700 [Microthyrium microscopicum]
MANNTDNALCTGFGLAGNLTCCYPNNQGSNQTCRIFTDSPNLLSKGCPSDNCIKDCQDTSLIYISYPNDNLSLSGNGPISRFATCVNVPKLARLSSQGALPSDINNITKRYIPPNPTEDSLRTITSSVTDCLSSTCRNSRRSDLCYNDYCSPVRLLTNSSAPNMEAINRCMQQLCGSGYAALPYADPDVLGIGVFASYILQCIFLVILWFGLIVGWITRFRRKRKRIAKDDSAPVQLGEHESSWIDMLLDFHKAQCYFSGTLMIASFAYGIFETNMLVTFMLTPLATNGILPIVFAYCLLVYYGKVQMGVTILTIIVYILSSVVYWTLYSHILGLSTNIDDRAVYQQFMYKLSAIPACGFYSALAACPGNATPGIVPVKNASHKIRVLTPIIWTGSTIILLGLLGGQLFHWNRRRQNIAGRHRSDDRGRMTENKAAELPRPWNIVFWFTTLILTAGMGMQLSLLAISKSLNMMDPWDWGFGQIVAVTIWIPPLLEYGYGQIKDGVNRIKDRNVAKTKLNTENRPGLDTEEAKHLPPNGQ